MGDTMAMSIEIEQEQKDSLPSYEELLIEHGRYMAAVDYLQSMSDNYADAKRCLRILGVKG